MLTDKFAVRWWCGCWVIMGMAFFFGIDAIPRALGNSISAAFIGGAVFGLISIAPMIAMSMRDN